MDSALEKEVVVLKVPGLPGNRLVFAPTGPVNRDYDDVRRFSDAAASGIKRSDVCPHYVTFWHHRPSDPYVTVSLICVSSRALKAGMQRPLLVCPQHQDYKTCRLVAALGALQALYMVRKRSSRDGIQAFSHFMSFGWSHHKWTGLSGNSTDPKLIHKSNKALLG